MNSMYLRLEGLFAFTPVLSFLHKLKLELFCFRLTNINIRFSQKENACKPKRLEFKCVFYPVYWKYIYNFL